MQWLPEYPAYSIQAFVLWDLVCMVMQQLQSHQLITLFVLQLTDTMVQNIKMYKAKAIVHAGNFVKWSSTRHLALTKALVLEMLW